MGILEALNTKVDFMIKSNNGELQFVITPAGYLFTPLGEQIMGIHKPKQINRQKIIDVKETKLLE